MRDVERDRGQAIGLVLVGIIVIAALAMLVVDITVRLADRSSAQSAADAAALAGALADAPAAEAAATAAASRNGGVLTRFARDDDAQNVLVRVTVQVGHEHADASASNGP